MKIAIPTDDGLNISAMCEQAKGFFIAVVDRGKITREEIRWNPDPEDVSHFALSVIDECQVLLASENWQNRLPQHHIEGKEIVLYKDTIITNVLVDYLTTSLLKESNTCCCP